jgi:hypothetical protein
MKGILSLIIFVSFGFAQDVLIANSGTEYRGEFINKTDNSISFKAERMLKAQIIDIKTIGSLILADGTVVIKNSKFIEDDIKNYGKEEMKKRQQLNAKWEKESVNETAISLSNIGGALIGVSGILLYTNNQKTLDGNPTSEEAEEFVDESKSNADLSYILLAIGGFLIAIGNG